LTDTEANTGEESQETLEIIVKESPEKVLEKILAVIKHMQAHDHSFESEEIQSKLEQGIW
jgi:hypothetical protein